MKSYSLKVWPEWKIEDRLGKGAFATVYKAVRRDYNIESRCAIKIISIPTDESEIDSLRAEGWDTNTTKAYLENAVNDFVSEIKILESLKGAGNIVSIEDYKVVEKTKQLGWYIFIRMELLTSLNNYLRDRQMVENEVIKLGCDMCSALEICSGQNIIHRDIKPENIFVNNFGDFKLGDFGIARRMESMTGTLSKKGTVAYIAPEILSGIGYDARVDIYSLGLVLYRLLNGNRLPFMTEENITAPSEREEAIERRVMGESIPKPSNASAAMSAVVLKACAYDADERFATAAEMKQALLDIQNGVYRLEEEDPDKTDIARSDSSYRNSFFRRNEYVSPDYFLNGKEESEKQSTKKGNTLWKKILWSLILTALLGMGASFIAGRLFKRNTEEIDNTVFTKVNESYENETSLTVSEMMVSEEESMGEEVVEEQYTQNVQINPQPNISEDRVERDEEEYVMQAINEASLFMESRDFQSALWAIEKAQREFPDNTLLEEKRIEVDNQRPRYLLEEVVPYIYPHYYTPDGTFRMGEKLYNWGYTCMGYGEENRGNETYFNMDGEYDTLSFTTGTVEIGWEESVLFSVYCDKELMYSYEAYVEDLPVDHTVNIAGCHQLVIAVYDGLSGATGSGTYGIANIYVTKNTNIGIQNNDHDILQLEEVFLLDVIEPYITPDHYENNVSFMMGGESFTKGFTCMGYGDENVGNKTYFNLEGAYSELLFVTGTVEQGFKTEALFTIYADGEIIFDFQMNATDLPVSHTVDIDNCEQLILAVYDGWSGGTGSGTYGFGNIRLRK